MDWSKMTTSKSHQRVGCKSSSPQIMGSNGQPSNTLAPFLLYVSFGLKNCAMSTFTGTIMQR